MPKELMRYSRKGNNMKNDKKSPIDIESREITILGDGQLNLEKPKEDMTYAARSATQLKEVVRKNRWITNIQGKEHLSFEAWQTIGKFYGYTVDTDSRDAEYVELGGTWGFKGHASVINERTGVRVGGASALCMSDERNWKGRGKFALMSMSQTRAGSKALRQILSWVVALAGYAVTPAEEMTDDTASQNTQISSPVNTTVKKEVKVTKDSCGECGAPPGRLHATKCSFNK